MRALIIALLAPGLAAAQTVSCPLTLPEDAVAVARPPAGWIAGPPSLVRLQGGGVMRGHPSGIGYLVPASQKKVKGGTVATFRFDAGEEKWLWCEYGASVAQIARRMDDAATACAVTTTEERRGVIAEMVAQCRAK
jgi:hypothetical protein